MYLGRVLFNQRDILPAIIIPSQKIALACVCNYYHARLDGEELTFEFYRFHRLAPGTFEWIKSSNDDWLERAVEGGRNAYDKYPLYFGRAMINGTMYYGSGLRSLYYVRNGRLERSDHYEVLVFKK